MEYNSFRGKNRDVQAKYKYLYIRCNIIPQVYVNDGIEDYYLNSDAGGTVEIRNVTDPSDENYNAAYTVNGGKSYHAEIGELVTVKAIPKDGYSFVGWYDESGNLVTTNAEYGYYETKESVKTFYARFADNITQTYIRQVGNDVDGWTDTTYDTIGTLGRYTYTDAVGLLCTYLLYLSTDEKKEEQADSAALVFCHDTDEWICDYIEYSDSK